MAAVSLFVNRETAMLSRNHKLAVQDGAGLGSIAKVNLELHYVLKARSY